MDKDSSHLFEVLFHLQIQADGARATNDSKKSPLKIVQNKVRNYQGRREQRRLYFPFPFLWHGSRSSAHPELSSTEGPIHTPVFMHRTPSPRPGWECDGEEGRSSHGVAGQGFEQPHRVKGLPACDKGVGRDGLLRLLPTQTGWNGSTLPTFPTPSPYPTQKRWKRKPTLGNYTSINSLQICWAEPCGTIKTSSLPVGWVLLQENRLFPANSMNTRYCFLPRQLCSQREGKFAVIPLLVTYRGLVSNHVVRTLAATEPPSGTACRGLSRGEARQPQQRPRGETRRAADLRKPQTPQSDAPLFVPRLAEGSARSRPQSNVLLK